MINTVQMLLPLYADRTDPNGGAIYCLLRWHINNVRVDEALLNLKTAWLENKNLNWAEKQVCTEFAASVKT